MNNRKEYVVVGLKLPRTSNELGGNFSEFKLNLTKFNKTEKELAVGEIIYHNNIDSGCIVRSVEDSLCTVQLITRDPEEILEREATTPGTVWFTK